MSVSRETDAMEAYAGLLAKWNRTIRLVGQSRDRAALLADLRESLILAPWVRSEGIVDLGSGNGLPAVPLAIHDTARHFTLIESDARKAAFLNAVRRDLALPNVTVMRERIEHVPPLAAGEIIARAFAPLARLLTLALPHLATGGRMLLLKGAGVGGEIAEARRSFAFDHEIIDVEGARGCVLVLEGIRPIRCAR